ncbi:MAG: tetratricopeptide repeat protein [Steroidobacteraceae bacterium]
MQLQVAGRLEAAEESYRAILKTHSIHGAANHCLGLLLLHMRRPADGLLYLLAALNGDPQNPDYWLGYLEALLLVADTVEAKSTLALGRQHGLKGKAVEDFAKKLDASLAAEAARAVQRGDSQSARRDEDTLLAAVDQGRFAEGKSRARDLTERHPERGVGWKVLGALLWAENQREEALSAMRTAVSLLPNDAEVRCNLGVALSKMERYDEAEIWLRQALQIDPKSPTGLTNLADACWLQGRLTEAEAYLRTAIALTVGQATTITDSLHTKLLYVMSHNSDVGADALFAEHCRVGKHLEAPQRPSRRHHANSRDLERPLRIGLVSGDFRNHPVANFIEPVLVELRNSRLQIAIYSNHCVEDQVSERLRGHVAQWRAVSDMSDRQLERTILDDRIDILIDLSGHTALNRLGVFARKPAPVQLSWIGYPGTTGLRAIDYYVADRHFLPAGQFEHSFIEKIAYLPAAWTFKPHANSPPVNGLPALEAGFVTFGSFNRLGKLNPLTVRLWSRLLRETPNSIMIMAGIPLTERRQALLETFNAEGIVSERVAFFPRTDMNTYLALHNEVDICLDTFPYTGGTTTNHALWMGVPTLTLAGQTPASRQCAANLGHLGLEGFIASDADDFVEKGLFWSTKIAALSDVRRGLRERWLKSPLRQPETIASTLDAAMRHMWRRWCRDLPAQSFSITASNQVCQ